MEKIGKKAQRNSRRKKNKNAKKASSYLDDQQTLSTQYTENSDLTSRPQFSFEGVSIESYAKTHSIHLGEVWRRIRNGSLVARPIKGQLFIFNDPSSRPQNSRKGAFKENTASKIDQMRQQKTFTTTVELKQTNTGPEVRGYDELPEAPKQSATALNNSYEGLPNNPSNQQLEVSTQSNNNSEIALLLDHLSLAKEENKEIIRLTQDTIARVTEMSESIVEMKDEVIDAKNTQIDMMKEKFIEQQQELLKLKQDKEDLEMLVSTVGN
jgi:hypothetical protein